MAATRTLSDTIVGMQIAVVQVEGLAEILHDLVEAHGRDGVPPTQVGAIAFALQHETRRLNGLIAENQQISRGQRS